MNGYELIDKMRKTRRRYPLSAATQALYYELVAICNEERWADTFDCSNGELCLALKITERSLIDYRVNLIQAGLIFYKSSKNRGTYGTYSFTKEIIGCKIFSPMPHPTDNLMAHPMDNPMANQKVENHSDYLKDKQKQKQKQGREGEFNFPPPPKKEKKVAQVIFRESEYFDIERLRMALLGTQYETANIEYYHEVILNWSDSKNAKKVNWLATAKNWMAKDLTEGKFISKTFKTNPDGSKNNEPSYPNSNKASYGSSAGAIKIAHKLAEELGITRH